MTPRELLGRGILSALDVELAETLAELAEESDPAVVLACAFASRAVSDGHSCLDLGELAGRAFVDAEGRPDDGITLPAAATFAESLAKSPLVDGAGARQGEERPFVLEAGGKLYLRRYYEYEARLARALRGRARPPGELVLTERLRAALERLFPKVDGHDERQRRAAELAIQSRLAVVSGGPGTGKTYTVAKILILLLEGADPGRALPEVALLAPTGKAAQRLGDSIRAHVATLAASDQVRVFPFAPMTIHRALGFQPATPTRFKHGESAPLRADLVVVDEASMVDLALMTKLVEAVRPDARLVFVGDKDQLASVEAGAILSEVCAASGPIAEHVVELSHPHRFEDGGGIAELSHAVNQGDASRAFDCFARHPNLRFEPLEEGEDVLERLRSDAVGRFSGLFAGAPLERLAALDGFRVLGCHLEGRRGVKTLNARIEGELRARGRIEGRTAFYDGRPVIVTANDYQAELFNGDVGVVAPRPGDAASLGVHFRARDGVTTRALSPARLPEHETAFALSVHKAQGSEFAQIALVLPSRPSPILTRELIYTAVTRARRVVTLFGSKSVLEAAIERRVERSSGLRDRLA